MLESHMHITKSKIFASAWSLYSIDSDKANHIFNCNKGAIQNHISSLRKTPQQKNRDHLKLRIYFGLIRELKITTLRRVL